MTWHVADLAQARARAKQPGSAVSSAGDNKLSTRYA